jgi:E3 ubiquitin-protein ligase NEDD4
LLTRAAGLPDPFAVATVNGEQTKSSTVVKKTLNPYWNEPFDM